MTYLIETAPNNDHHPDGSPKWTLDAEFARHSHAKSYILCKSRCYNMLGEHQDGRKRRYDHTTWAWRYLRVTRLAKDYETGEVIDLAKLMGKHGNLSMTQRSKEATL